VRKAKGRERAAKGRRSPPPFRPAPPAPSRSVDGTDDLAGQSRTIQAFIDLLKQHNLAELEFAQGEFLIRLKREVSAPAVAPRSDMPAQVGQPAAPEKPSKLSPEQTEGLVTITSPIVGTFYRSPSPDADPYVEEGDLVKKGQVLCIVEAMKLMNEIESEVDGRVVKILAESTKPVEYGQPLFLIDPAHTT